MKKLEKFSAANSGWTVVVFAVIGYLLSVMMSIFGVRKKSNTEEAETVPTESTEDETETQTETQEE